MSVTIPEKIELLEKAEIAITQAIGYTKRAYPTRDPVCLAELYECQKMTREQLAWLLSLSGSELTIRSGEGGGEVPAPTS